MTIKTILITLLVIVHFSIIFAIFWFILFSKYKSVNKSENGNFGFNENNNIKFENPMDVGTPFYNNTIGVFSDNERRKRHETISSSINFNSTNPNNIF